MANDDKTDKPAVKIEKANERVENDLRNAQQLAKRVARVLTKEAAEEAEDGDITGENSQQTTDKAAQLKTPHGRASKSQPRETQTSKNARKKPPTDQEKLIRAAKMRDLLEMVEETKAALITLRNTIHDSEKETIQTISEFRMSGEELIARTNARETKNKWSNKLTKFVADDAGTVYKTEEKQSFGWDDLREKAVELITKAPGVKTSIYGEEVRNDRRTGGETQYGLNKPEHLLNTLRPKRKLSLSKGYRHKEDWIRDMKIYMNTIGLDKPSTGSGKGEKIRYFLKEMDDDI